MGHNWKGRSQTAAQKRLAQQVKREEPICRCEGCPQCEETVVARMGCIRPSTIDDHIVPLAEGGTDDRSNHRGICGPCSDHKTQQEATRGQRRRPTAKRPREQHPGWTS